MIMVLCSRKMASLVKILNNFRAEIFDFLVRQNYLEFCKSSHIPRTEHHNRLYKGVAVDFELFLFEYRHLYSQR